MTANSPTSRTSAVRPTCWLCGTPTTHGRIFTSSNPTGSTAGGGSVNGRRMYRQTTRFRKGNRTPVSNRSELSLTKNRSFHSQNRSNVVKLNSDRLLMSTMRHQGRNNFLFADGHVKSAGWNQVKWRQTSASINNRPGSINYDRFVQEGERFIKLNPFAVEVCGQNDSVPIPRFTRIFP